LDELRFRNAELAGVSFPKRLIELIVVPWEREALVPHPNGSGRMVEEVFSRGSFDGIERRANRVRVNRDHELKRTVGRALSFHPSREEGLVATVKIASTELGDETLALADEECLDASAGYLPMPDGEKWETRTRMRITKGWLGHIALTPDPAHVGARVLAVRNAEQVERVQVATPNLDQVRAWLLQERYSQIQH